MSQQTLVIILIGLILMLFEILTMKIFNNYSNKPTPRSISLEDIGEQFRIISNSTHHGFYID